jgi:two-component system nitrogen regulation sensor histidine kinase NtrY
VFLFPALAMLFGAVWLSLYLAKRITAPLRLVALGAERIASGERGVRVEFPEGNDEFAALIGSFNKMSERLLRTEEEVGTSRLSLQRKNQELEERRRLQDAVLETVGTGLLLIDAEGALSAANPAALRFLGLDAGSAGRRLDGLLRGPGREEILELAQRVLSGRVTRQEREV